GYYLEITNANETKTPAEYKHQKTLKNAKRYYTPALREYEEKVVTAQDKSRALELQLFGTVRDQVAAQTPRLLTPRRSWRPSTCWRRWRSSRRRGTTSARCWLTTRCSTSGTAG